MTQKDLPATIVSWSSGKDSAFALHQVRQQGNFSVVGLLTTLNGENSRVSIHGVRRELLERQLEAIGLPAEIVMLPVPCDNDAYQKTMGRAIARLRENSIEHVVFGDLFLEDIRQYRVDQMLGTGIAPLFPLWLKNTAELSRKMVDEGLRAIITTVDLRVLPIEFVGRQYDHDFLNDLPDGVDPCGENGEFHTVAIAGPMFSEEIEVEIGERYVSGDFAYIDVIPTKDMTR